MPRPRDELWTGSSDSGVSFVTASIEALKSPPAAAYFNAAEPVVVVVEGTYGEWVSFDRQWEQSGSLPVLDGWCSIVIGVCDGIPDGEDVPSLLSCCDIVIVCATQSRPGVRTVPTLSEARITAQKIEASVRTLGQPAVTAAQVMRLTEKTATVDGLVVESLAFSLLQAGPRHRHWLQCQSA